MSKLFDRSKFKAAQLSANKAMQEAAAKVIASSNKRGDYHTVDEGMNRFRILPPHNENEPSWQVKCVSWLPVLTDEEKDGEKTGKKVRSERPIFDARVHGGLEKSLTDEYIKYVKNKVFENFQDKDERSKKLAPINGYRNPKTKIWTPGILPSTSFVCYATKNGIHPDNIGRLEVYRSDMSRIEELNVSENSDEPILVDLFSDPDEGVELIIIRQKDSKGNWERIFKKAEFNIPKGLKGKELGNALEKWQSEQRVSDSVLEALLKMQSLVSIFQNAYSRRDFERELEALQYFDEKNEFGAFEDEEFLAIVETISEEIEEKIPNDSFPHEEEEEEELEEKEEEEESDTEKDNFDLMDRSELKSYIKTKGYNIIPVKSMSDDDLREKIRTTESYINEESGDLPFDEEIKKVPSSEEMSSKDKKYEELRARLAARRK